MAPHHITVLFRGPNAPASAVAPGAFPTTLRFPRVAMKCHACCALICHGGRSLGLLRFSSPTPLLLSGEWPSCPTIRRLLIQGERVAPLFDIRAGRCCFPKPKLSSLLKTSLFHGASPAPCPLLLSVADFASGSSALPSFLFCYWCLHRVVNYPGCALLSF